MLVLEGFYARISGRACNRCSMSVVSHALALHLCNGIQLGCFESSAAGGGDKGAGRGRLLCRQPVPGPQV